MRLIRKYILTILIFAQLCMPAQAMWHSYINTAWNACKQQVHNAFEVSKQHAQNFWQHAKENPIFKYTIIAVGATAFGYAAYKGYQWYFKSTTYEKNEEKQSKDDDIMPSNEQQYSEQPSHEESKKPNDFAEHAFDGLELPFKEQELMQPVLGNEQKNDKEKQKEKKQVRFTMPSEPHNKLLDESQVPVKKDSQKNSKEALNKIIQNLLGMDKHHGDSTKPRVKNTQKILRISDAAWEKMQFIESQVKYFQSEVGILIQQIVPETESVVFKKQYTKRSIDEGFFPIKGFNEETLTVNIKNLKSYFQEQNLNESEYRQTGFYLTNTMESLEILKDTCFKLNDLLAIENENALYSRFNDDYWKFLKDFDIEITQVYKIIDLASHRRAEYTAQDIIKKCDSLHEQLQGTDTQHGKQVRQVKYVLGNPVGKKMYDAWLTDKLNNYRKCITALWQQVRENQRKAFINFENLCQDILQFRAELDQLNNFVINKIKEQQDC